MFAARYFPARYFAPLYFPEIGADRPYISPLLGGHFGKEPTKKKREKALAEAREAIALGQPVRVKGPPLIATPVHRERVAQMAKAITQYRTETPPKRHQDATEARLRTEIESEDEEIVVIIKLLGLL